MSWKQCCFTLRLYFTVFRMAPTFSLAKYFNHLISSKVLSSRTSHKWQISDHCPLGASSRVPETSLLVYHHSLEDKRKISNQVQVGEHPVPPSTRSFSTEGPLGSALPAKYTGLRSHAQLPWLVPICQDSSVKAPLLGPNRTVDQMVPLPLEQMELQDLACLGFPSLSQRHIHF